MGCVGLGAFEHDNDRDCVRMLGTGIFWQRLSSCVDTFAGCMFAASRDLLTC